MRRPKSNLAKTREPNWQKRTMWTGNNLDIMRGMNSASADLIYLAPPFNSNRMYSAPIGSEAAGAAFKDTWTLGMWTKRGTARWPTASLPSTPPAWGTARG